MVTGASRGIGEAVAESLAEAGAQVIGTGRSPTPERARTHFAYQRCDVLDNAAFTKLCDLAAGDRGRIDILVNAAGITLPENVDQRPSDTFRDTLALNLSAVYDCCLSVVPFMREHGGSIINVTSIGAALGFPGNPGYVASKGGLAAMSRALALDLGVHAIRVNNLAPGYVRTAMTAASHQDAERHAARAGRTILGRWGEPEDIAGAAIFLASDASSYVTGADLFVDGGWTAKGL